MTKYNIFIIIITIVIIRGWFLLVKWYQEDNWFDDASNQHCLLCKVTYDNSFNTLDYIIFDAIVKRTTKDNIIFIIQDIMHTMKECEENNNMFE